MGKARFALNTTHYKHTCLYRTEVEHKEPILLIKATAVVVCSGRGFFNSDLELGGKWGGGEFLIFGGNYRGFEDDLLVLLGRFLSCLFCE